MGTDYVFVSQAARHTMTSKAERTMTIACGSMVKVLIRESVRNSKSPAPM